VTARTADRCARIGQSATVAINDKVKALRANGVDILDVGGGDPDFGTAEHVSGEAIAALHAGFTHYTPSRGVPELLRAISGKLWRDNGITADPSRDVIVTPSSKHALFIALMAILDPGDEVLIPSPSWVSYQSMAHIAGARPVPVELRAEDGFALSYDRLLANTTARTKAIVINTPNNPTGHVLRPAEADAIAALAVERDLVIVTDEIYEKMIYRGGTHISMAAWPGCADRTLTVNGFSKAYAMPGWRLGYVAGPADIIAAMLAVHQHTVACAGSFVQRGGVAALNGPQDAVRHMVSEYSARADIVVRGLDELPGVTCHAPDGTFYAFADIRETGVGDSARFAESLLERAAVAVTPGSAFGPGGEGYVRLSFATSVDVLRQVLARMADFLRGG
jgi:aspartate aminotransferase